MNDFFHQPGWDEHPFFDMLGMFGEIMTQHKREMPPCASSFLGPVGAGVMMFSRLVGKERSPTPQCSSTGLDGIPFQGCTEHFQSWQEDALC